MGGRRSRRPRPTGESRMEATLPLSRDPCRPANRQPDRRPPQSVALCFQPAAPRGRVSADWLYCCRVACENSNLNSCRARIFFLAAELVSSIQQDISCRVRMSERGLAQRPGLVQCHRKFAQTLLFTVFYGPFVCRIAGVTFLFFRRRHVLDSTYGSSVHECHNYVFYGWLG
jgi:hypothetical protein